MIGNIVWEALFSQYFVPYYGLIHWGNTAWVAFDIGIFLTVWKYGPDDFSDPFVKRHLRKIIPLGMVLAAMIMIPFTKFYHDEFGTFLGWAAAFMMSILFIAMLLRRNHYKGQSIYIALSMFLGNIAAYFWVEYFPEHEPPMQMDHNTNLAFVLATGVFNVAYIVMLYQKFREKGVNPWKRIW